jgi:DNA-binding transcriptional LysR family regulator
METRLGAPLLLRSSRHVSLTPAGDARSLAEPIPAGLACIPVADAAPSRLVVAWSQLNRRPLIASFVDAAIAASASRLRFAP